MNVVVNGDIITTEQIEAEAARLRPEHERTFTELPAAERETQLLDWARENVIERTLLQQYAEDSDITLSPEDVDQALAALKVEYPDSVKLRATLDCDTDDEVRQYVCASLKVEALVNSIQARVADPTDAQIEDYYQTHTQELQTPERIHAAHIVKHVNWQADEPTAREQIQRAQAELQKDLPFPMVAEKYSDCPEGGGDLGVFARGQMVEEFEDVIFNLAEGQTSDIFRTRYGFHIATVYSRQPQTLVPLADLRVRIVETLRTDLLNEALYAFLDDLKAKADISE
ncbi:peptidylprolyl isomerase [Planctomycetota bacterium]